MRVLNIFIKTIKELYREVWTILLTLITAPFFIFLYWLVWNTGPVQYTVLVLDQDAGVVDAAGDIWIASQDWWDTFETDEDLVYENGIPMVLVQPVDSVEEGVNLLEDKKATMMVTVSENFSAYMQGEVPDTEVNLYGDISQSGYSVASLLVFAGLNSWWQNQAGSENTGNDGLDWVEHPLGSSATLTDFDISVPALVIVSIIMIMYPASMFVVEDIENQTLIRLKLSGLSSLEYLLGITVTFSILGAACVAVAFYTGQMLGFESQGSLWNAILVGALTGLSMIGIGLIVSCYCKTVLQTFMVVTFPMFLMFFFTGAVMPVGTFLPVQLFGYTLGLNDLLPPRHAVNALQKIMIYGAGLKDVGFELIALTILSLVFFFAGVILFERRHLRVK